MEIRPELGFLKGFFKDLATKGKGLLGERLSLTTLIEYSKRLATVFPRERGETIDNEVLKQLRKVSIYFVPHNETLLTRSQVHFDRLEEVTQTQY
jgi:hypothetical protein